MNSPTWRSEASLAVLLAAEFGPAASLTRTVTLPGATLTVTLLSDGKSLANPAFMICVRGTIDGEPAQMYISRKLLDASVDNLKKGLSNVKLDWRLRGLLAEAALAEHLDALEGLLKAEIAIEGIETVREKPEDWTLPQISFSAAFSDGTAHTAHAVLPRAIERRLVEAWSGRVDGNAELDPPLVVAIRVGLAELARDEFDQLEVDDVIVFDESPLYEKRACLLISERLAAQGEIKGKRLTLIEPVARAETTWNAALSVAGGGNRDNASSNGRGHVTVVADIVRRQLTISQLLRTDLDSPIDLPRSIETGVDLFVGAELIGSGRIVRVGEAMGIRLYKVAGNG